MYITSKCTCIRRENEGGHIRATALEIQERVRRNEPLVHLDKEFTPEKVKGRQEMHVRLFFTGKVPLLRLLRSKLKEMNNYRNREIRGFKTRKRVGDASRIQQYRKEHQNKRYNTGKGESSKGMLKCM